MKFIEIDQRSPEWYRLRKTKIGASDCPKVMGSFRERRELFYEKHFGSSTFVTAAMEDGILLEPMARHEFCQKRGVYNPKVVEHPRLNFMIASLDGLSADESTILEVKIVKANSWQKFLDGDVPKRWLWQIQHQLACTEAKQAYLYVCYANGDEWMGQERVIEPNQEMIGSLEEANFLFYDDLINYRIPEGKYKT